MNLKTDYPTPIDYALELVRTQNAFDLPGDFEEQARILADEVERLRALINNPHTSDFMESVSVEAAYQQERWGYEHDLKKHPAEWFQLLFYLFGKAAKAFWDGNREKYLHHIVTGAAVCLNWHRQVLVRWPAPPESNEGRELQ